MGRLQKLEQSNVALNNALHLMTKKVGLIQAWHDHSQRTHVEVMDKVSSMQSWMTKFENNLSIITRLLLKLEPLFLGSHVPPAQKQFVETFACENGGGELHVLEEGVRAKRLLEGVVVVDKSAIESPPLESQPTQQYLGFTQFVEKPTCTNKVNLTNEDKIIKSNGMEPKALEVQENPKALSLEGT